MKQVKIAGSFFTFLAILLTGWSIYELVSSNGNIVQSTVNLIYFFSLFIAFFCARISMGLSGKITLITYVLSSLITFSSTYTWVNSAELFIVGKYTIGLLPILIGVTMISSLSSKVKWSKFAQIAIASITLSLSACVFTGAYETLIYEVLFVGMIFITLVALGLSLFTKTN